VPSTKYYVINVPKDELALLFFSFFDSEDSMLISYSHTIIFVYQCDQPFPFRRVLDMLNSCDSNVVISC
jgi:hypothetical protein